MAINFPTNPSLNDTFTSGGKTFQWNGTSWTVNQEADISTDTTPTLGGNLDGGAKNISNVGIITATSFSGEVTIGDAFVKDSAVGLGTESNTGRDAGISTATGTVIYVPDVGMQVYSGAEGGWKTVANTAAPPPDVNNFGNGGDGAFNSTGNTTLTVTNKNGNYDGDMMVKQYTSFTLNAGHTLTTDQPCRGLVILCTGDVSISGTLSMAHRGAYADAADNSTNPNVNITTTVPANGLIWRFVRNGGGQGPFTPSPAHLNGAAPSSSDIYTWLTAQNNLLSGKTGYEVRMKRQGENGGNGAPDSPNQHNPGQPGTNGVNTVSSGLYTMSTGGGGGGHNSAWDPGDPAGAGSYGSCFGGGSGGGGNRARNPLDSGQNAGIWGGAGGFGDNGGSYNFCGGGGAGNGGGSGNRNNGTANDGGDGTGGLIVIIAKGNVTVNSNGEIDVRGNAGGSASGHPDGNRVESAGGGSGAGICLIAHGGTYVNNGTTHTSGGAGGVATPVSSGTHGTGSGGAGGTGSLRSIQIDV